VATVLSLAESQRLSQQRLKDALEARLVASYKATVGPTDTRPLVERWIAQVMPTILAYRSRSASIARVSYNSSRALALPGDTWMPPPAPTVSREAIATSLLATGFAGLIHALNEQKLDLATAMDRTAKLASGAGVRHALNGGREFSRAAAEADRLALGWYRVTRPGCCYFCAALASRGPVYKGDSFDESDPRFIGPGEVKVHDHCVCGYQAQWTSSDPVQSHAAEFKALWDSSTKGYSGNAAMNAFRRAHEAAFPTVERST
jgi:hypothetical protein